MTESLSISNRLPNSSATELLHSTAAPAAQTGADPSSQFLSVLKQQLMNSNPALSDTLNSMPTGNLSAALQTTPGQSISPALAEIWLNALMQSLPVPGMQDDSGDGTLAGNASLNSMGSLSTTGLLQMLQNNTTAGNSGDLLGVNPAGLMEYSNPIPGSIASTAEPVVNPSIDAAVNAASAKYGVPKNLILAVIHQESGMDSNAVSPVGAQGLMQLMPDTARSLGVMNSFDPVQNVDGGTRYLSELLQQFSGDTSLALAGYNAGPGAVQAYGGIPPYAETQNYVKSVLAKAQTYAL